MSVSVLFISACVRVGPQYRSPDTGLSPPPAYQHAPPEAYPVPEDRWWEVFGDPEIDRLVQDVLKENWDVKQAAARVLERRAHLASARADRFPRLEFTAEAQRQRQTVQIPFSVPKKKVSITDAYNLSLAASFEVDLWGRLARAEEAARERLLAEEENRRTVAQTVVAEALTLYFQAWALGRRLGLAERRVENLRKALSILEGRYRRGLVSLSEVKAARRTLKMAEASLPLLREELGQVQQRLCLLLGRYPRTTSVEPSRKDYVEGLRPVPPGLPSELLERRPDLRAAKARLRALTAEVGVAKAARFPRITLTGSYGYASEDLEALLSPQSLFWRLAAGLVQPVFEAGRLKAAQRAAEAQLQEAVADYAKRVLQAFYEVERSLMSRKELFERREKVLSSLREAEDLEGMSRSRYHMGLIDYLQVLEAERMRLEAEEELVLVDLAILTNRVALHRALGGGWAEPPPAKEGEDERRSCGHEGR